MKCWGDRECVLLKVVIREGNSVPLSPAFARPCVCFKLLQALQPSLSKRVSVRHLERGKGEGGLFLPFVCVCVCVWEEEWHGVWLSTQLFKSVASPSLNWGCLFAVRPEVLLLLVSQKEVSPGSVYEPVLFELAVVGRKEGGNECCALLFFSCTGRKKLRSLSSSSSSSESAVVTVCWVGVHVLKGKAASN